MNKKGKTALCLLLLAIAAFLLMPKSRSIYGISDGALFKRIGE